MHSAPQTLMICEGCGKLHRWPSLSSRAVARCIQCEAVLGRGHRLGVASLLALTLAALFVFLAAHLSDVAAVRLRGPAQAATFPMAIAATWREGERIVAVLAAFTAIVAPGLFIALRLYVLVPLAAGRVAPGFHLCMRWLHRVSRWNMVEVLTVAAVVSIVRLAALAEAEPGPALYALGLLALLLAAIESAGVKHLWRVVE
jgi:paraquat-inducible protein A